MSDSLSAILLATALGVTLPPEYRKHHIKIKKQAVKCGLASCGNMTTHNGGFCCAEHSKLWKEQKQ